jgi:3-deoxy-D-manno-octulosonic-acid transferase
MNLVDVVYLLLLVTCGPFVWLGRRFRRKTGLPIGRRLGRGLEPRSGGRKGESSASTAPLVWIHAVSVGEVTAVRGLVTRLRELRPGLAFLVTTTTTSGFAVAQQQFGAAPGGADPAIAVRESPVDFSFAVRRYFDAFRPTLLVLVEGELWPNLLHVAEKRGVPVVIVNARVSDRSFGRYRFLTAVWPGFLRPVLTFCVQSAQDAGRLARLGVDPQGDRVAILGNIKFDNATVEEAAPLRSGIRASCGIPEDAPVLVAGSTHPGEEEAVIGAFEKARAEHPSAVLVLAPRHLERVPQVRALLDGVGFSTLLWTRRSPDARPACILVDTIGELSRLYAAADAAFVGGSLRPIGGHNLLEPARFGIPMFAGPHLASVRSLASSFEQSGALTVVRDEDGLARELRACFSDRVGAAARGKTAQATIVRNQGAARLCAEVLVRALDASKTGTHES